MAGVGSVIFLADKVRYLKAGLEAANLEESITI